MKLSFPQIVNPNMDDAGLYECQVSYHDDTEKKLKMPFSLKVLGKFFSWFVILENEYVSKKCIKWTVMDAELVMGCQIIGTITHELSWNLKYIFMNSGTYLNSHISESRAYIVGSHDLYMKEASEVSSYSNSNKRKNINGNL